jgi:NADH dehydrogenase
MKSKAPATWDEAELLQVSMTSETGTAGAEALGVMPRRMSAVLGAR